MNGCESNKVISKLLTESVLFYLKTTDRPISVFELTNMVMPNFNYAKPSLNQFDFLRLLLNMSNFKLINRFVGILSLVDGSILSKYNSMTDLPNEETDIDGTKFQISLDQIHVYFELK